MEAENEIWKDVIGWEGFYQISNFGNVKSLERQVYNKGHKCYRVQYGRVLKPAIASHGYRMVHLLNGKISRSVCVHRLVIEAFIPNSENKKETNHKDGNKLNNNVDNLEWATYTENINHALNTGLNNNKADTHYKAKITSKDAVTIRRMRKQGIRITKIKESFNNLSLSSIGDIIHNITWKQNSLQQS